MSSQPYESDVIMVTFDIWLCSSTSHHISLLLDFISWVSKRNSLAETDYFSVIQSSSATVWRKVIFSQITTCCLVLAPSAFVKKINSKIKTSRCDVFRTVWQWMDHTWISIYISPSTDKSMVNYSSFCTMFGDVLLKTVNQLTSICMILEGHLVATLFLHL